MSKSDDAPLKLTDAVGDYLKAIWTLSREGPASTNAIATHLGFSPASVSGMLGRLAETGLVTHRRYRGAELTERGKREALRLIRRHRLIETFMISELGYGWDEVHEEAEAIEHTISDRFAERLAALLGNPSHDPHGDPIPTAEGVLPPTPDVPLTDLTAGASLRVARLLSQDADVLTHLGGIGLAPGAIITVTGKEPRGGLLAVDIDGNPHTLSRDLAGLVRGERV